MRSYNSSFEVRPGKKNSKLAFCSYIILLPTYFIGIRLSHFMTLPQSSFHSLANKSLELKAFDSSDLVLIPL